jgi:hypothetical protein
MGVQRCPKCESEKPDTDFFKNRASKTGLHSYCKPCSKRYEQERYPNGKPGRRPRYFQQTYGMTVEGWEELFDSQNRVCAICGIDPVRPVVDHCHSSGKIRGILCDNCNRGVGLLKDDHATLLSAAMYLMQHEDVLSIVGGDL